MRELDDEAVEWLLGSLGRRAPWPLAPEDERERLRLEEFRPRPLSTFVRNRLIDEVYLPLIGDNMAKQMGALGDDAGSWSVPLRRTSHSLSGSAQPACTSGRA